MSFNFDKRGLIFAPEQRFEWMQHYAQVPVPLLIGDILRIYFTCRPEPEENGQQVSHIGYVDYNKTDLLTPVNVSENPIIELGGVGDFDEHGVHPCTAVKVGNEIWLYYQGWQRSYSLPYITSLGLAISKDNGITFKKIGKGPLFSRTVNEPYLENGFFVFKDKELFRMVYATCNEWTEVGGKLEPIYFLTQATSTDGINWKRDGLPIIESLYDVEASGRPSVYIDDKGFHMWFCFRNVLDFRTGSQEGYKIGYAFSENGINWLRDDRKSGINLSEKGWDSEMQAYPYVKKLDNQLLLFYNGNNFGRNGFGLAVQEV